VDPETLVPSLTTVAVAVVALVGVLWSNRRRPDGRVEIEQDVRIANSLPAHSEARAELERSIARRVTDLVASGEARRDPAAISLAFIFAFLSVSTAWISRWGGWWNFAWLRVVFFGAFGIYGFVEGMTKTRRDTGGRRVRSSEANPDQSG
jgi:hypothetical protein